MVIDTSATTAIALNEPDAPGIEVHIADGSGPADLCGNRAGSDDLDTITLAQS